ncbi:hypothetical protein FISHEDRAFT_57966 [Fistulina hepatica ATCC 64428]|uniref:Uncharacterized protein n=1 Tax=Fistulina hepatica ATCC 64428 TaxID=1128425 RepID=A0A0D7AE54_9AGAR|nr:hypothetical protein FISHEDRAFT_57966 [Fistulina hepatica ATCC 64428]
MGNSEDLRSEISPVSGAPGESLVLNSAERAPYLLIIGLLGENLDFDPFKGNNRDIVKKVLEREHTRHGAYADLVPFGTNESSLVVTQNGSTRSHTVAVDQDVSQENLLEPPIVTESPATPTTALDDNEEMDLVEQVWHRTVVAFSTYRSSI